MAGGVWRKRAVRRVGGGPRGDGQAAVAAGPVRSRGGGECAGKKEADLSRGNGHTHARRQSRVGSAHRAAGTSLKLMSDSGIVFAACSDASILQ